LRPVINVYYEWLENCALFFASLLASQSPPKPLAQKPSKERLNASSKTGPTNNVHSLIDETAEHLRVKRGYVEEKERAIDVTIRQYETVRKQTKAELLDKSRRIGILRQSVTEIDALVMLIREKAEAVDKSSRRLSDLDSQISQLRRLAQNMERDKGRQAHVGAR
jgi:hypothetical protein